MSGIRIDGNLNVWPEGLRRYVVEHPVTDFDAPTGHADFEGWFRVGYDGEEGALASR